MLWIISIAALRTHVYIRIEQDHFVSRTRRTQIFHMCSFLFFQRFTISVYTPTVAVLDRFQNKNKIENKHKLYFNPFTFDCGAFDCDLHKINTFLKHQRVRFRNHIRRLLMESVSCYALEWTTTNSSCLSGTFSERGLSLLSQESWSALLQIPSANHSNAPRV